MKKVSTTAAKQTTNCSQQRLTIGLDLGDRWSHDCELDESGRILTESKGATSPNATKEVFGKIARARIALGILTYSSSKGAFIGASPNGAELRQDHNATRNWYSDDVSFKDILSGTTKMPNEDARAFVEALQ